jgi:hypothetical protein
MMSYTPINYNVVALICQDLDYKKMTSDDVLGGIMNYEMNIQEAKTLRISTRMSQRPRSKVLLSKQTRARRRKF